MNKIARLKSDLSSHFRSKLRTLESRVENAHFLPLYQRFTEHVSSLSLPLNPEAVADSLARVEEMARADSTTYVTPLMVALVPGLPTWGCLASTDVDHRVHLPRRAPAPARLPRLLLGRQEVTRAVRQAWAESSSHAP